jgi:hypothetical protein
MWLKLTNVGWDNQNYIEHEEPVIRLVNMDKINFTSPHEHGTKLVTSDDPDVLEMIVAESIDEIWAMINGAQT